MFEDRDTSFFRPWDNRDATTRENRIEEQEDAIKKDVKHEDRRYSGFERGAVDSIPLSSRSFGRRRRRKSDSSVRTTSSSSSKVEDESRNGSLESSKDSVLDCPLPSGTDAPLSNPPESRSSRLNGRSLYDAPRCSIDYLQGMTVSNEPDSLRSDGPWLDPVVSSLPTASTTATTGHPFYYRGFPSVLHTFPQELQAPFVEHAVGMLQRQEAVAKQMRKLRPKKFRCEHCDVAFSNNGQLKGHIRIHTGERPFKCDAKDCGKSFTRNEELTRHKRIHTGLRPHACVICGKCFGRKDHLKKHMRTHENRDPYKMSAATLGMIGLGNTLPQNMGFFPYFYPT